MKKHLFVIAMLLVAILSSSCSVWRAERQYKVARLNKAKEMLDTPQPQYTVPFGKKNGIISNTDQYRPIRIVIRDEKGKKKSFFLAPNQWLTDYLADGEYTATAYRENREIGCWEFKVESDVLHSYMGNEVYWYLVYTNSY